MRANRLVAVVGLLNALIFCFPYANAKADQDKARTVNRGSRAAAKMSATGQENTNAQWSADPDHGWVRAEERHKAQESKKDAGDAKQIRGKQKGKTTQSIKH